MLRSFLSIALMQSVVTAAALDPFTVPAFEFQGLTTASSEVLAALQQDGIIALRNIPQYGELRRAYLQAATKCALTAASTSGDHAFLQTKTLLDGTERFTISSTAGKELLHAAQDTQALCPEYVATYRTFSQLVETVVDAVGKSLDATHSFTVPSHPELTGSKLLSDSVHLDHFHAYESVPTTSSDDLSLEMHVDNGMMIAMTAPYYFEVSPSSKEPTALGVSETEYVNGLMIENRAGKLVQPVFKQDELVLMVGAGFQEWVRTTPPLRPVPHGMKFPTLATTSPNNRLMRAWFGKMVLLAPDQVMVNTKSTFKEFATASRRFLMQDHTSGDHEHDAFAAIACPKDHRRLHGSDKGCVVKKCSSKAGKNPELPCSIQCNMQEESRPGAARLCEENCECEVSSNSTEATYCWMLCSPKLPEGTCDSQGQRCATGAEAPYVTQQKYVCASTGPDALKSSGNVAPIVPTKASSASSTMLQITLSCVVVILVQLL